MTSALTIVNERFAKGEISKQDYEGIVGAIAQRAPKKDAAMGIDGTSIPSISPVPKVTEIQDSTAWKSLVGFEKAMQYLLIAYTVISGKMLFRYAFPGTAEEIEATRQYLSASSPSGGAYDLGIGLVGLALTVVIFVWIFRLTKNLFAQGIQELKITPGWSVGWFFVPIAFFWKPYQAISQLERAAKVGNGWQSHRTDISVISWWICYWLSAVLFFAAQILAGDAGERASGAAVQTAMFLQTVSTSVEVIGWLIVSTVLGQVSKRLSDKAGVPYKRLHEK